MIHYASASAARIVNLKVARESKEGTMRMIWFFSGIAGLIAGVQVLPVLGAADYVVRPHDLCELIHPGETQWQNCEFTRSENRIAQILGKERGSVNMRAVAIEKTGSQINY